MTKNENNLNNSLSELSEIVTWFENQNDVDVEEGLKKVKRGAQLVKLCKSRLKEIENDFKEIQADINKNEQELFENL